MTNCTSTEPGDYAQTVTLFFSAQETLDKDKTKYLCGTAPWAAPEVLRGEKAQTQSDIW